MFNRLYGKLRIALLALAVVGFSQQLQGQTGPTGGTATPNYCTNPNSTTLTCPSVVMEALWVRLAKNVNIFFTLNAATVDPGILTAINNNAINTYTQICQILAPNTPQVKVAFDQWWVALNSFYLSPGPSLTTFLTQSQILVATLAQYYNTFLAPSQQAAFASKLSFYVGQFVENLVTQYNFFLTSQFDSAIDRTGEALKWGAFIGVFLDKSLSGTVPN